LAWAAIARGRLRLVTRAIDRLKARERRGNKERDKSRGFKDMFG
jgi:hypothetical protein